LAASITFRHFSMRRYASRAADGFATSSMTNWCFPFRCGAER